MKRSEMLDHIKQDILKKLEHEYLKNDESEKWSSLVANDLLDILEAFGMLPPVTELTKLEIVDNAWEPEK